MAASTRKTGEYIHPLSLAMVVVAAVAMMIGLGLLTAGIFDLYFEDTENNEVGTSVLSPLFLERARPAGDLLVAFDALREASGSYTLSVLVQGPNGGEQPPDAVLVQLISPAGAGVDQQVPLPVLHPSTHFQTSGIELAAPGQWQALVIIQRDGGQDVSASFDIEVTVPDAPA